MLVGQDLLGALSRTTGAVAVRDESDRLLGRVPALVALELACGGDWVGAGTKTRIRHIRRLARTYRTIAEGSMTTRRARGERGVLPVPHTEHKPVDRRP